MGKILGLLLLSILTTFQLLPVAESSPHQDGAYDESLVGRGRTARLFDTYVTHVIPPPVINAEPVFPRGPYGPSYMWTGMIPPGYSVFHPFDLGLPLDYVPEGHAIYCPLDFVYDGYMDPFERGICYINSYDYYY